MVGCAMQTVQLLFESNSFPLPGLLQDQQNNRAHRAALSIQTNNKAHMAILGPKRKMGHKGYSGTQQNGRHRGLP